MNHKNLISSAVMYAICLAAVVTSIAIAQQDEKSKATGQGEMKLPPGWTLEDVQAYTVAGTPGKQHELLTKEAGVWQGKNTMWFAPGAEPVKSECTSTVTPIMDGRYVKVEMSGEMPGMGPYTGVGTYGFDNTSKK